MPNESHPIDEAIRSHAQSVAEVGYQDAPKGHVLYWEVNTVNRKMYIGMTNGFRGRVTGHLNAMCRGNPLAFYQALRKHGQAAFVFVPIEYFDDEHSLAAAEHAAIKLYRTQNAARGYNIADGGSGIGSQCAKAIHARPDYREYFLSSYPARALKAAETRRRNRAMRQTNGVKQV